MKVAAAEDGLQPDRSLLELARAVTTLAEVDAVYQVWKRGKL